MKSLREAFGFHKGPIIPFGSLVNTAKTGATSVEITLCAHRLRPSNKTCPSLMTRHFRCILKTGGSPLTISIRSALSFRTVPLLLPLCVSPFAANAAAATLPALMPPPSSVREGQGSFQLIGSCTAVPSPTATCMTIA